MSLPDTFPIPALPSPPAEQDATWQLPTLPEFDYSTLPDPSFDMHAFTDYLNGLTPPASDPDYDCDWPPPPPLELGEAWVPPQEDGSLLPSYSEESLSGTVFLDSGTELEGMESLPYFNIDLGVEPFYFGDLTSPFSFHPTLPFLPLWPTDVSPPAYTAYSEPVELVADVPLLYPPTLCTPFVPPPRPYSPIYYDESDLPPSRKRAAPVHVAEEEDQDEDDPEAQQPRKRRKFERPQLRIVTSAPDPDTFAPQPLPPTLPPPALSPSFLSDSSYTTLTTLPSIPLSNTLQPKPNPSPAPCCSDASCPACLSLSSLMFNSPLSDGTWMPHTELDMSSLLSQEHSDPQRSLALDEWLLCLPQWPSLSFKA